jgi:predicted PurR-regulated permease PerM
MSVARAALERAKSFYTARMERIQPTEPTAVSTPTPGREIGKLDRSGVSAPGNPTRGGGGFDARHAARPQYVAWRSADALRTAGIVAALYIALRLIWFAQLLVLTAFLGILFGLAVGAGVDWLRRFRIPRAVGAVAITFGSLALIVGFFAWSAPTLTEQSKELRTKLPESIDKLDTWLAAHRSGFLGALIGGEAPPADQVPPAPVPIAPGTPSATGPGVSAPASASPQQAAPAPLRDRILTMVSGVRQYLFGVVSSTVAVIGGVVIVIFLAIYVAADPDTYHDGLMVLFPRPMRRRAGEVLTAVATALRRWLVTQLIAMVMIGVLTTVALLIIGVRAAFPLGVLAGLLEFIPTIGPLLSAVPAIAMGFVDSPEKALIVGAAFFGIQFVENNLLIPILMKEGMDLPPAVTLMGQALLALVFGFLGLLVAVPLVAAVTVVIRMLYVEDIVGQLEPIDPEASGAG